MRDDWTPPSRNELAAGAAVVGLAVLALGSLGGRSSEPAPVEEAPAGPTGLAAMPEARVARPLPVVATTATTRAPAPTSLLRGSVADLRAAGRVAGRSYVNPEVGLRLDLPAGWRSTSTTHDQALVGFTHPAAGALELFIEGARGETLEDHANASMAIYNDRYLDSATPVTHAAQLAGRSAVRVERAFKILHTPTLAGAQALRADWVTRHRGWVLRVTRKQLIADGRADDVWQAALAGLRFTHDAAALRLEGGEAPRRETFEEVVGRLAAPGAIASGRYTNPALGLSFACPLPAVPAAEPVILYRTAQARSPRIEVGFAPLTITGDPLFLLRSSVENDPGLNALIARSARKRPPTLRRLKLQGRRAAEAMWRGWIGNAQVTYTTLAVAAEGCLVTFTWFSSEPDPVRLERFRSSIRFTQR